MKHWRNIMKTTKKGNTTMKTFIEVIKTIIIGLFVLYFTFVFGRVYEHNLTKYGPMTIEDLQESIIPTTIQG